VCVCIYIYIYILTIFYIMSVYKILLIYICCAFVGMDNKLYNMHGTYNKIIIKINILFFCVCVRMCSAYNT